MGQPVRRQIAWLPAANGTWGTRCHPMAICPPGKVRAWAAVVDPTVDHDEARQGRLQELAVATGADEFGPFNPVGYATEPHGADE